MHTVRYGIAAQGGARLDLAFEFDERFALVREERDDWPAWTRLEVERCDGCPLDPASSPRCPVAEALVDVIAAAGCVVSHEATDVTIERGGVTTVARVPAQDALRSLMGLLIPASGCPRTAFFRPMARFHAPLSDPEETLYRAASMHRLAQHLRASRGLLADPGLQGLAAIYGDLNVVNRHVTERLRAAVEQDSALNAVVLLDVFAQLLPMQLDEPLAALEPLFDAYLV